MCDKYWLIICRIGSKNSRSDFIMISHILSENHKQTRTHSHRHTLANTHTHTHTKCNCRRCWSETQDTRREGDELSKKKTPTPRSNSKSLNIVFTVCTFSGALSLFLIGRSLSNWTPNWNSWPNNANSWCRRSLIYIRLSIYRYYLN